MKFSEIEYKRPDIKAARKQLNTYLKGVKTASSEEELCQIVLDMDNFSRDTFTMAVVAHIRNTLDMTDTFYEQEMQFFAKAGARLQMINKRINKAILASPHREGLSKRFGDLMLKDMENEIKLMNAKIIPLMIKEHKLTQQYSKDAATASTDFRGEKCNFYGLLKHMESTDRDERAEAFRAWAALYEQIAPKLDATYDQLVALRVKMAKKLGFDNYIDYIYPARHRYDYTAADVAAFRKQVKEEIVPICDELYRAQKERLGIDRLHIYDERIVFAEGNAIPKGNKDELVQKALEFYRALSPETGEFFGFMVDNEMFDLETRPGKHMGGYCTFLPKLMSPFIFSNFNGTLEDVNVLTHEAGHAFEAYTAARIQPLSDMVFSTSEINEIHSMSMEHFAYPYADLFFGEEADKYRYAHLVGALTCIPYLVCVDEFQHRVFENPTMTAMDRRKVWRDIERTYMPWRDYDGNEFLEGGGFWMQKQHIFLYPFYYIDYALAQICAFQIYGMDRKDHAKAWDVYMKLCRMGGSRGYLETLQTADLKSPFAPDTVASVMRDVKDAIDEFAAKL